MPTPRALYQVHPLIDTAAQPVVAEVTRESLARHNSARRLVASIKQAMCAVVVAD
jgi:hypothetical protein